MRNQREFSVKLWPPKIEVIVTADYDLKARTLRVPLLFLLGFECDPRCYNRYSFFFSFYAFDREKIGEREKIEEGRHLIGMSLEWPLFDVNPFTKKRHWFPKR